MKEEIREVLGFKVPMQVYESVQEADTDAGKEGATLAECNNNLLYRGTYADGRELIWDIVQELTKVPPQTRDTGKKDEKGQAIYEVSENEAKYVERALATETSITKDQVQKLIDERARGYTTEVDGKAVEVPGLRADIRQRVRQAPKPKKLAEEFRQTAQAMFTKGNVPAFLAVLKRDLNEDLVLSGDQAKDTEAVGWAVKRHIQWQQAQLLAQYKAMAA